MVYKNNPIEISSQELNGYIPISNFKNAVVKNVVAFKHEPNTSIIKEDNNADDFKKSSDCYLTLKYSKLNKSIEIMRVLNEVKN